MKIAIVGYSGIGTTCQSQIPDGCAVVLIEADNHKAFDTMPEFRISPVPEPFGYPISGREARRARRKKARSKNQKPKTKNQK